MLIPFVFAVPEIAVDVIPLYVSSVPCIIGDGDKAMEQCFVDFINVMRGRYDALVRLVI